MPVYQYEGVHYDLPDGLTNEQAISKIKTHLGREQAGEQSTNILKNIGGGLEAAVSTIAPLPSTIAGGLAGLNKLLTTGDISEANKTLQDVQESNFGFGAYKPFSEKGKQYAENVGEALQYPVTKAGDVGEYLVGSTGRLAGELGMGTAMAFVDPLALGAGAKALVKPRKPAAPTPSGRYTGMAEELNTPVKEAVPETPPTDTNYTALLREKQTLMGKTTKEAKTRIKEIDAELLRQTTELVKAKERETTLAEQSAFNPKEAPGGVGAFDEMSQQLRAGETSPVDLRERNAVPGMAEQLLAKGEQERATTADEVLAQRQTELEQGVARQTSLDTNAAERARQENAPILSEKHRAEIAKRQTEADAMFDDQLRKMDAERKSVEEQLAQAKTEEQRIAAQEAQRVLDERQTALEFEITKQQRADFGAAERARQEAATQFPGPLGSKHRAEWNALKERAEATRALIEEQTRKTAEIDKMWEDRPNSPERAQTRLDEEAAKRDMEEVLQGVEERMRELASKYEKTGQGPKTRAAKREEMQRRYASKKQGGFIQLPFGDKNKGETLKNIPGIGERLTDIGHAQITSPEQAIDLAKTSPDVSQNIFQKGMNVLTKGGEYLKGRVDNPVYHYAVDRMLKGKDNANAEISQKLHGEYLSTIRELSKQDYVDTFDLLNKADLNQKTITQEMMDRYGLPQKMQEAIRAHQALMSNALEKVNAARKSVGKDPITAREAYSAMSINGAFRKVVYKTVDGEKRVVGVIASDMLKGKLGWSLEKIEAHMAAKDPAYEFSPLIDHTKFKNTGKNTPHEAFTEALALIGKDNPHIADFLDTLREVAKEDSKHYMGMDKHLMQKKGVFGTEGRKPWLSKEENARQFFENQSRYLENALSWGHMAEAAADVNKVLRNEDVIAKHGNAIALSEQYMQQALGINTHTSARVIEAAMNLPLRSLGLGPGYLRGAMSMTKRTINSFLFSLNPVFWGLQLMQPVAAMPALATLLKSRGVSSHVPGTFGLNGFVEGGYTLLKNYTGMKLTDLEAQAIKYAKDNHIYADDMIEHTTSTRKGAAYYANKVAQGPGAKIEVFTRAQMYMALVHLMKDAGLTPEQGLFQQAHRFTDMGMNRMDSLEKPQIYEALGPIGTAAYNLSSFKHNEISRWAMYADEIMKHKNPSAALPILTQMSTTLLMAGMVGLPFYSAASALYDKITEWMGKPRSLLLDTMEASNMASSSLGWGDKGRFAFSHGAGSFLGVDVSRRLGFGEILPTNVVDAAFPGASKLWQAGRSTAMAVAHPTKPEYAEAAMYNLAPSGVQGYLDTKLYQRGNLTYSKDPDKLHTTGERTPMDTLLKKWGLTGIQESVSKSKDYEDKRITQVYSDIRASAMNAAAQDVLRGRDPSESLSKWVKAEGDPASLDREIGAVAMKLNLSPQTAALLKDAASKSITRGYDLQRRVK